MKRILSGVLAAGMLLSLGGCGKKPVQQAEESSVTTPEYSLEIVEPETGKPATNPADTVPMAPETVTEVVTVTQIVTVTSVVTVTESAEPGEPYDAGTLTEAAEPLVVEGTINKDGTFTTKDDVALYIYTYGELPKNFISKKEAQKLGWEGGSLEPYAPGCCIGGSYFGNYEGKLPEKKGREYTECDIDTLGKKSRGAKRIVFSNDGLIYYTGDHYETFELLYGEE